MLDSLKDYLNRFGFLTTTDISALLKEAKLVTYQKGERIVSAGDMNHCVHVVLSGFVRIYVLRADGEERTVHLANRGLGFGSSQTLFANAPSNEFAEALEKSAVLMVDIDKFKAICDKNPRLYKFYALSLERNILEAVERLHFHSVMNPDQRYEYLLKHRLDIIERVSQKYIASYIGITPVSLSRLRARIASGD